MTACLSDDVLWSLSEGGGTAEEGEHLQRCRLCAHRANRLAADLRVIVQVLGDAPPPAERREPARLPLRRFAMVAAVVVAALGLSLFAHRPPSSTLGVEDDGIAALGEMSTDVFGEADVVTAPSATDEVVSALAAAAPCEWQLGGCQDIGQPLF